MRTRWFAVPLFLLLIATSCTRPAGDHSDLVKVVASFYPLAFVAEEVGGDAVEVENLTPPSAEPHDLELSPGQVTSLTRAALVIFMGDGFQPSVEEALRETESPNETLDVLSKQKELRGDDPHIWLDPTRLESVATLIGDRLARIDSGNANEYRANVKALVSKFETLDKEFKDSLAQCARRNIVTSHEAFGYLAAAYNLEQIGISGIDPEQEPSPARLAEVAELVKRNGVTTIYFEAIVSPALADTLARESGAKTAKLDPLEGAPEEGDYFTAMRANLTALKEGLGCP